MYNKTKHNIGKINENVKLKNFFIPEAILFTSGLYAEKILSNMNWLSDETNPANISKAICIISFFSIAYNWSEIVRSFLFWCLRIFGSQS